MHNKPTIDWKKTNTARRYTHELTYHSLCLKYITHQHQKKKNKKKKKQQQQQAYQQSHEMPFDFSQIEMAAETIA
jgi:hypothetical protein